MSSMLASTSSISATLARALLVAAVGISAACGNDSGALPDGRGLPDSSTQTVIDAATQNHIDAAMQTHDDASTQIDANTRTRPDAFSEPHVDASTQAHPDAATQTPPDAATQAHPDAATQAQPDANSGGGNIDASSQQGDAPQANGPAAVLTKTIAEPASTNCPFTGQALHAGLDSNFDGILEDNEILTTSYACNAEADQAIFSGDFTVSDANSAAQLNGYSEIQGSLIVSDSGADSLTLATLVIVDGDVIIDNSAIQQFSAPLLSSIAGQLHVKNDGALASLALPQLVSTGDQVDIEEDSSLTSFDLSSLTTVGGNVVLSADPSLTTIALPKLTSTGAQSSFTPEFDIERDDVLTAIDVSQLANEAGNLYISNNASLPSLSLPALTSIGGVVDLENDTIATSISIAGPFLVTVQGNFFISNQPALTTLSLPSVQQVNGTVELDGDAALASIDFANLQTIGNSFYVGSSFNAPSFDQPAVALQRRYGSRNLG